MLYPVVLAGGKGERFWPYSNAKTPKQLLPLVTEQPMLLDTLSHLSKLNSGIPVHIIASKHLEAPIRALLKKEKLNNVILVGEPMPKNTAAAVALACKLISAIDPDGVMAVLTADHAISPSSELAKTIKAATKWAEKKETLVTFGIKPLRPDTGYGYIEAGALLETMGGVEGFTAKQFHEKPDVKKATTYCKSGKFFWNSGMFVWKVSYLWSLYEKFLPQMYSQFNSLKTLNPKNKLFYKNLETLYPELQSLPVDKGIMEKAPDITVLVPKFSWDDVGAWSALERMKKADKNGNHALGRTVAVDTSNTLTFSEDGLIATLGVKDLLVVQHHGVTLVVSKNRSADLKLLLEQVKKDSKLTSFL